MRGKCARQISYALDSVVVGDSLDPQAGRQAVLKQIDVLTGEGLIGSLPDPAHKRSPLHAPTSLGEASYQAVVGQWQQHVRDIAGDFSSADLDAAIRVLPAYPSSAVASPHLFQKVGVAGICTA